MHRHLPDLSFSSLSHHPSAVCVRVCVSPTSCSDSSSHRLLPRPFPTHTPAFELLSLPMLWFIFVIYHGNGRVGVGRVKKKKEEYGESIRVSAYIHKSTLRLALAGDEKYHIIPCYAALCITDERQRDKARCTTHDASLVLPREATKALGAIGSGDRMVGLIPLPTPTPPSEGC